MNFLIDANMPRSTKAALQSLGHDVLDVRDVLPTGAPDSEIASLALREGRAIITRDLDFANILLYPPEEYPGVIVLKVRPLNPGGINRVVELFLMTTPLETISHSLIILEETRYRIKK